MMGKKSFKIDNYIYKEDIIKQAISDFEEVVCIRYENNILEIESDDDIEEIFGEFFNYVTGLTNEA